MGLIALRATAAFLASLAMSGAGLAQVAPALPDAKRAIDALVDANRPAPAPYAGAAEIPMTSQTAPANAEDVTLVLRGVAFEGGTIYAPEDLADLTAPLIGTEITVARIFALAAAVQRRYRDDGYLFNRVIVPAQSIDDGVVRLEMIEAVLETVEIESPGAPLGPVEALAERIVAPLRGMRNPTLPQIERVLLLLNDIPGVMRAAAVPKLGGDDRGAVRLYINMEREALGLTLFADNRQSPLVGRGLYGAVASLNSWSSAADTTTLSLFGSADFDDRFPDDFKERWTVQLEHERFLTADGLRGSARALWSRTRPGGDVKEFKITGEQAELEFRLTQPLLRSRALSAEGWIGFAAAEFNGEVPAQNGSTAVTTSNDSLRVASLGLNGTSRDPWGSTELTAEWRLGLPVFGASSPGDDGLSRSDGDGAFNTVRGTLSRLIAPPGAPMEFWVQVSGQWADRPLLSSEEFSLGGAGLARAYDPSEYSGDLGVGAVGEVRVPTSFDIDGTRLDTSFYLFGDAGRVLNLDGGAPDARTLISAGGGVRAALPGGIALNLEAAKPMNEPLQRTNSRAWRFFFSASKSF